MSVRNRKKNAIRREHRIIEILLDKNVFENTIEIFFDMNIFVRQNMT